MNLQIVPARTGLHWATQGVRTFWRQPLALTGLFFLFMATVSLVSIVPFIGSALALVLLPALTLGMMAATQTTLQGKFPMPSVLFTALKAGPQRKSMLHLGGWYAVLFLGVMVLSMLADGGTFAQVYLGGSPMTPEVVNTPSFQAALWISMVLYIPVSMMFWHAPALVHWPARHERPVFQPGRLLAKPEGFCGLPVGLDRDFHRLGHCGFADRQHAGGSSVDDGRPHAHGDDGGRDVLHVHAVHRAGLFPDRAARARASGVKRTRTFAPQAAHRRQPTASHIGALAPAHAPQW